MAEGLGSIGRKVIRKGGDIWAGTWVVARQRSRRRGSQMGGRAGAQTLDWEWVGKSKERKEGHCGWSQWWGGGSECMRWRGPWYAAWIVFQEQWEVSSGFTSWLLWFVFGVPVSLILLLSRVNDAQFSLSQGNAWILGGLEPSILCCHCPSPVSPPSVLALSENPSSFLTEGPSWNWGIRSEKGTPSEIENNRNLPGVDQCHLL